MLKFLLSKSKTNSYFPTPWHLSTDPFPAFRGEGFRHTAFFPFHPSLKLEWDGWEPTDPRKMHLFYQNYRQYHASAASLTPCRVIRTQKGTDLLVPATPEEDEKIVFITSQGGFRGSYSRIDVVNGDRLLLKRSGGKCVQTAHIVARLRPGGYVVTETGRRKDTGIVEVFTWDGRIGPLSPEEFDTWAEFHNPTP